MKIKVLFCLFSLLTVISCAFEQTSKSAENPVVTATPTNSNSASSNDETFTVAKKAINLSDKNNNCVLSYKNGAGTKEVILEIAPPCKVVRRDDTNEIQSYKYQDIKATVFIIGGEVTKNGKCKVEMAANGQVILVKRNGVFAGKKRDGNICLPGGTDEKELWLGSH